jgi:hypothetical protein
MSTQANDGVYLDPEAKEHLAPSFSVTMLNYLGEESTITLDLTTGRGSASAPIATTDPVAIGNIPRSRLEPSLWNTKLRLLPELTHVKLEPQMQVLVNGSLALVNGIEYDTDDKRLTFVVDLVTEAVICKDEARELYMFRARSFASSRDLSRFAALGWDDDRDLILKVWGPNERMREVQVPAGIPDELAPLMFFAGSELVFVNDDRDDTLTLSFVHLETQATRTIDYQYDSGESDLQWGLLLYSINVT